MRSVMVAVIGAMAMATGVAGQPAAAGQDRAATAETTDAVTVIAAVRKAIADNYVVADKRAAIDSMLAEGLVAGRYAGLAPDALAQRVTDDLRRVANDKHLGMRHDPRIAAQMAAGGQGDEVADGAFFRNLARKLNHGVAEMRVLPGNVRLVGYHGFVWTGPESAAAIDQAIAFLKGGDAAIIDLRRNGGGSPEAVRYLASHFVAPDRLLVRFFMRADPPTESRSVAELPSGRIEDVPVYVLTSGNSASAAEEFAAHVRGFGFGQLVGETTMGAAYRNEMVAVPGGFVLSVSVGRPELPGGGDWEAKGIAPHVAIPEAQALDRAHALALTRIAATAPEGERLALRWQAEAAAAKAEPRTAPRSLAAYAGRYGVRTITQGDDRLVYRRDGGVETPLIALGDDLFALEADPETRIAFVASGDRITGLDLLRANGGRERIARE